MEVRRAGLNAEIRVAVKDLHKEFVLRDTSIGSLKSQILWWKKRTRIREVKQVIKGVSFDVYSGECLAIIGRNGAGKSTTLGILARVMRPTTGSIEINGRVAPLLELGAGFHADLTGRQNVVFNGMLLGLSHKEVLERMDEIIDFSEIREYIDMPVRTYSSGMKARLGYSVAAHVDADILIIDEALSVGDFRFVKKCEDHIRTFKDNGGTILYVSHGLEAIKELATRCIWIENGVIAAEGDPEEVIAAYKGQPVGQLPPKQWSLFAPIVPLQAQKPKEAGETNSVNGQTTPTPDVAGSEDRPPSVSQSS